ncbi:MAG TPA: ABC transporter substrate-binding protein [Anaeromyxobacteraceae bacterium]|nr:ABC transporter substrate-binding protein [Anaeromyxobacteraceae bacterium]
MTRTARTALRARPFAALLALALAGPAAGEVQGVTDSEVLFGQVAPFSGAARELGRQMKVGLDVAFSVANDAGGVAGRKLRLVAFDDGYEPARTLPAMKELAEKRKVFGFVGNVGTPTTAAALPYALDRGMLFFGAFTGTKLLRNDPPDRFVFNYRASYQEETAAVVKYLVEVRRFRPAQIAVFAQEDAFGDDGFSGVAKAMRRYRQDPGRILRVGYKRNTIDVAEAVKTIGKNTAHLKAVVMVGTYRACAKFIEKVKESGAQLVFTNVSFVGSNELAEELVPLGARFADGVVVTQVVPLPTAGATAILRYREALAKYTPGERPGFISLEGYLAGTLLVEGLKRAGKNLTTDTLVDALEAVKNLDLGVGVPLTFGPSEHQASHKVWGTVLDGSGVYKSLDLE